MTLTQFKYLLSIVENQLNITKAAESSSTSQPGISKQIKLSKLKRNKSFCCRRRSLFFGLFREIKQLKSSHDSENQN